MADRQRFFLNDIPDYTTNSGNPVVPLSEVKTQINGLTDEIQINFKPIDKNGGKYSQIFWVLNRNGI